MRNSGCSSDLQLLRPNNFLDSKLNQSHNSTCQPRMSTRSREQLMMSSHMPAGQRRAASDGDTVLDTRHSAVIRRIAHFSPCPQGIFQGTAGPAERGRSWFISPKGHRERRQAKSHTAEKHGQLSCAPYGSGLRH